MKIGFHDIRHFLLSLLIAMGVAFTFSIPNFDTVREMDIDVYHLLHYLVGNKPQKDTGSDVVIVAIDEASYTSKPFLGLPRVMWTPHIAQVQNAIFDGGARAVAWDLILPTSAASYLDNKNYDKTLLKSLFRGRKENRIVLGSARIGSKIIQPNRMFLFAAGGNRNIRSLNVQVSADGIVRSVPVLMNSVQKNKTTRSVPSMAVELASRMEGDKINLSSDGNVNLGATKILGVQENKLFVNFSGTAGAIPTYSLVDLWRCQNQGMDGFFRKEFNEKIVIFGLVLDIEDRKLTSNRLIAGRNLHSQQKACTNSDISTKSRSVDTRSTIPGVYVHATAVNNILNNESLTLASSFQRAICVAFLCILALLAAMYLSPVIGFLVLSAGWTVWTLFGVVLFNSAFVMPLLVPLGASAVAWTAVFGLRVSVLDRRGKFLQKAFSSYVSPALVKILVSDPGKLSLGGERREMSFIFTDLEGYTTLVEHLDPKTAVTLLNEYFDQLVNVAKSQGGTIDKIVGDALFVVFSAPIIQQDHARLAVNCALEIDKVANKFAEDQQSKGIQFGQTRIGVHSGTAVVGNLGGSGFFDYTAIGDAVNVAARLEGANKYLGSRIAVSEATAAQVPDFSGRPVGDILLKGRSEPISVFELLGEAGFDNNYLEAYCQAFELMRSGNSDAQSAFEALVARKPDDPIAQFHVNRLLKGETGTALQFSDK